MRKIKADLKPLIKHLDIVSNRLLDTKFAGRYQSVFKGMGLEFDSYRDYTQLDDASKIDWKASARANRLVVKNFVEERGLNVFFLVDVSSSMVFGSTRKLKHEFTAEIVASLSHIVLATGDKVGYGLFNDKVIKKMPPMMGPEMFYSLKKELVDSKNYGGKIDYHNALKFLLSYLKEMTLVILISDFIGITPKFEKILSIISKKYDLIAIKIRDPRDQKLPQMSEMVVISDPYSKKTITIEPNKIKDKFSRVVAQRDRKFREIMTKHGVDLLELSTDKPFVPPITKFFRRRAEKWR